MMIEKRHCVLPPEIKDSLQRYVERGIPTGGFLRAVLENNLTEAFGRADINNCVVLFEIVSYVYNELPSDCWGSEKKVDAWLKAKREEENNGKAE